MMAMHITEVCKDVAKEYLKTETSRLSTFKKLL